MSESAKITNLDSLKELRAQLVKYCHSVNSALDEADGEIQHTINWLKNDQYRFWQAQIRKLSEKLTQAKINLQNKQHYAKSGQVSGNYSFVDEKKVLAKLQNQLENARHNIDIIKSGVIKLERDAHNYRAAVQPLAAMTQTELPKARNWMDYMIDAIEAYLASDDTETLEKMTITPLEEIETENNQQE